MIDVNRDRAEGRYVIHKIFCAVGEVVPNLCPARADTIVVSLAALTLPLIVATSSASTATSMGERTGHDIVRCAEETTADTGADDETTARLDPKIVAGLIAWVGAKTGWHDCKAPAIRFVPDARLREMFTTRGGDANAPHIDALYSPERDIIYLPTRWSAGDLHDRAALLHELIHHLQIVNKVEVTCPNVYEFQAYSLTIDWLREQGVEEPLKILHINDVVLFMLSQCPIY